MHYHNLNAMALGSNNQVKCYSIEEYKKTLQHHIACQNWRAVLATQANMQNFLNDTSNQRIQAFADHNRHLFRSAAYGSVTLLAAIFIRPRMPKLLTSGFFGTMATYCGVKAATVTPENIYNKEQRWLTKTIKPIEPMLSEFLHQQPHAIEKKLTTKHG